MKKGKSNYTLQFNCSQTEIQQIIQNYLNANEFSIVENKGERYYRAGNSLIGYRAFNYYISGQTINIQAWLDGFNNDFVLEQNSLNVQAMNYKNSLNELFQSISNFNKRYYNENVNSIEKNQINQNNTQHFNANVNEFANKFQNEATKKQEKMCEIGFWISLLGVICAFMGITYGLIIYILDFYFAAQGLKTKKKPKAIATIVLSLISIFITIIQLLYMMK